MLQYLCEYWGEVPLPLSEGGLLWEFDEDVGVDGADMTDVGTGRESRFGEGVGGAGGQRVGGHLVSSGVRVDGDGFRAMCYRNMMRLLTRSREVGSEVRDYLRVDDMHCVGRLFVLAARRAGRVSLDETLVRTLTTMFDMEESVGLSYHDVGRTGDVGGGGV